MERCVLIHAMHNICQHYYKNTLPLFIILSLLTFAAFFKFRENLVIFKILVISRTRFTRGKQTTEREKKGGDLQV